MVASGSVGTAFGMVVAAGAASSLGSAVVFCVSVVSPAVLAASLGFAAGVMLYVVFTEIFMNKTVNSFVDAGHSDGAAFRLATACFFGGLLLTGLLDAAVHRMMHWAARRRKRRLASNAWASQANLIRARRTSSGDVETGSMCRAGSMVIAAEEAAAYSALGEEGKSDGSSEDGRQCAVAAALQGDSASERDVELASTVNDAATTGPHSTQTLRGSSHARIQPCTDCCGPAAARVHSGNAGGAVPLEYTPSNAPAEVVAVLQQDPHTADLLRMGVFTGLAIALHNLPEGLATFVGAMDDVKVGASVAFAIAIHNIPEGICVAMPIYYATKSRWKGFMWGSLTGLAEPLGGLLGYLVLKEKSPLSFGIVFGIVAGMMVYVSIKELLPSSFQFDPKDRVVSTSVLAGMGIMALSLLLFTL